MDMIRLKTVAMTNFISKIITNFVREKLKTNLNLTFYEIEMSKGPEHTVFDLKLSIKVKNKDIPKLTNSIVEYEVEEDDGKSNIKLLEKAH